MNENDSDLSPTPFPPPFPLLEQEYQKNIPARNLHFVMGTVAAHPQTLIMIGLLRTGLDPEKLDMQGELF